MFSVRFSDCIEHWRVSFQWILQKKKNRKNIAKADQKEKKVLKWKGCSVCVHFRWLVGRCKNRDGRTYGRSVCVWVWVYGMCLWWMRQLRMRSTKQSINWISVAQDNYLLKWFTRRWPPAILKYGEFQQMNRILHTPKTFADGRNSFWQHLRTPINGNCHVCGSPHHYQNLHY